jgi:tripartite-type tricarboxylate transporter receptor subunit TctC
MLGNRSRRALLWGAAGLLALPSLASAQSWPTQPIRLIVPFAPGGSTDLSARLVAQGLSERLGQSVVVENRAGAGATVGSQVVADSRPDGHTLVMSSVASHAIGPALYGNLRYDAVTSFTHVVLVVTNPSVWVVNRQTGINSLADLVREAKARPGGLDMASSGSGSSNHLLLIRFGQVAGIPVTPMMSDSLPSAAAHVRQGSVRAIAMSSARRHPSFPEVPTFREQGFDLESSSWFGLSGPAGLPPEIVARLHGETMAILAQPETQARFAEFGGTPGDLSPEGFRDFVAAEVARWAPVVRASGATVD